MDRAKTADEFHERLRPWHVPTFCLVFADVEGHIGYHATGRIPIRNIWERGYRPGWDPRTSGSAWSPSRECRKWPTRRKALSSRQTIARPPTILRTRSPARGATTTGPCRARERIQSVEKLSREQFSDIHQDVVSARARNLVPKLMAVLKGDGDARVQEAVKHLAAWDYRATTEAIGPTLFDVFFATWTQLVIAQRFEGETAALLSGGGSGLSAKLLSADPHGWFAAGKREPAIREAFRSTLDYLANRLGPDMQAWSWGNLHRIPLKHVLTARGELGSLLDQPLEQGGPPCQGSLTTVCNVSPGPDWNAKIGAGYRLVADMSTSPPELSAIDCQSASGHPGSPHYADQLTDWLAGRYHRIPLDRQAARKEAKTTLTIQG